MVAIVIPERPVLEKWAKDTGIDVAYETLLADERTSKLIIDDIKARCKEAGFFGFEIPTRIHLSSTLFSIENDLLTPTFKLKRNEAKRFFLGDIKRMYDGAKLQGEE